jgi:hypothetical protein
MVARTEAVLADVVLFVATGGRSAQELDSELVEEVENFGTM